MHFGWITKTTFFVIGLLGVVTLSLCLGLIRFNDSLVRVVFLSVGQGDAILIQSGRQQILIDGGRGGSTLLGALGQELPFYDRTIEVVIATHPDADHIGGLSTLLDRYQVGQLIETGALTTNDTVDAKLLLKAIERTHTPHALLGRLGTSIELAQGGVLTNDGSIVARFDFGETSFLFTGDLADEEEVLPDILPVDVLKVAHHGSRYSTSDAWLDLVQPREAIVSVGKNAYGHPAPEVMERLKARGIASYRTDELGPIGYRCFVEEKQCFREE
jgi:competence protein ComEC